MSLAALIVWYLWRQSQYKSCKRHIGVVNGRNEGVTFGLRLDLMSEQCSGGLLTCICRSSILTAVPSAISSEELHCHPLSSLKLRRFLFFPCQIRERLRRRRILRFRQEPVLIEHHGIGKFPSVFQQMIERSRL